MIARRTGDVLTMLVAVFIIAIGVGYLVVPESIAPGFGLPSWPSGEAAGFLNLKGVRDVASGVILATLLLMGRREALGWVLLGAALIPIGDGSVVLAWGGSTMSAIGVHYLTAATVVAAGLIQLRATDTTGDREAGRPAATA